MKINSCRITYFKGYYQSKVDIGTPANSPFQLGADISEIDL